MGAFCWHWMLEAGVGLPLGYGKGIKPSQFVYRPRKDGLCIGYNDGAIITAKEARTMAKVARWVSDYHQLLWEIWEKMPAKERENITQKTDAGASYYLIPIRKDFIERAKEFADWAEKSKGFRIY